jgi:hypothetical protein
MSVLPAAGRLPVCSVQLLRMQWNCAATTKLSKLSVWDIGYSTSDAAAALAHFRTADCNQKAQVGCSSALQA